MNKSATFFGNSVFGQLIFFLPAQKISRIAHQLESDRYTKRFTSWEHLVSMLFCCGSQTTSLRDVTNGLLGLEGKLRHLNIKTPPKRSTLSDANKRRSCQFLEKVYYSLLDHFKPVLSDSRFKNEFGKHLSIIDSTTIPLFTDILKCVGRKPHNGKHKGGIKVHMQIRADYNSPTLIKFTSAATHDNTFMDSIKFEQSSIYVFDNGYTDYERFELFIKEKIPFVTRLKNNAVAKKLRENHLDETTNPAVLIAEQVLLPLRKNGLEVRSIQLRKVAYWDDLNQVCYEFITNIEDLSADKIAAIYKCRWQIELLNKQLKQNQPLQYFLGDNENAIKIQIWCSLIWNLLLTVLKRKLKSKNWAFSNIVSMVRIHLFNYIHIINFLNNPQKNYQKNKFLLPSLFDT